MHASCMLPKNAKSEPEMFLIEQHYQGFLRQDTETVFGQDPRVAPLALHGLKGSHGFALGALEYKREGPDI